MRDPFAAETIAQTIRARHRSPGRQLDQHQRAVLHRDGGADPRQHADPGLRRAHRRARHRERAGRVGRAEIEGDRHPARDGHRARAGAARVPDPGRRSWGSPASLLGSLLAWGFLLLWRGVATNPDGTPLFIVVIEPSLFAIACVGRDARRHPRRGGPGPARGAARSGGGDPWLSATRAPRRCASTGVRKSYGVGTPVEAEVLHGIDLDAAARRIRGADRPVGLGQDHAAQPHRPARPARAPGDLFIAGQETSALDEMRSHAAARPRDRLHLPVPLPAAGVHRARERDDADARRARAASTTRCATTAAALLDRVGLTPWRDHKASDISGGQQQRVAIARALAMNPALVLADEPSGNLDTENADAVFDLMREVNETSGTTFLIVTHDPRLAQRCDRIIELVDGRIVADAPNAARRATGGESRASARASRAPATGALRACTRASRGRRRAPARARTPRPRRSCARRPASRGSGSPSRRATSCRAGIDRNARVSSLKPTVL